MFDLAVNTCSTFAGGCTTETDYLACGELADRDFRPEAFDSDVL
jgi:hypothetical protein